LTFPFWEEDFYWVAPSFGGAVVRERITSDELSRENLMLLSEGHCLKDHALAACQFSGAVTHSMSATSLNTLIQLVIAGLGSTLVPEMALEQLVRHDKRLVCARLDEPGPHRNIAFVIRATYPKLDSIQALKDVFSEALDNR
jgi:LysR family hydrogen peroxide-inducible transcriptional activator